MMESLVGVFSRLAGVALVPVLVGLLLVLLSALLELGELVGLALMRWRARGRRRALEAALAAERLNLALVSLPGALGRALTQVGLARTTTARQRALDHFEDSVAKTLARDTLVIRLGPALGLMGTLIPLGPALEFLANGQLEQMTQRLILAFATTVVGMGAAALATLTASFKRRLYASDWRLLLAAVDALEATEQEDQP